MRKVLGITLLWMAAAACSQESSEPEGAKKKTTYQGDDGGDEGLGIPLDVPAFAFGPYATAAGEDDFYVEIGQIERRVMRGDQDMSDEREFHAAVTTLAANKVQTPGCADVSTVRGSADGDAPALTGGAAAFKAVGGVWRADMDSDVAVDADLGLIVGGADVEVPATPDFSGIKLAGAYDAELSVILDVRTLSAALEVADADLLMGDNDEDGPHDLSVVTFHGGRGAAAEQVRCVFKRGDSANAPATLYHQVLPLRRITWQSAKIETGPWRARFSGQAIEDLRVP